MSTHQLIPIVLATAILCAQPAGVLVTGEIQARNPEQARNLFVELYEMQGHRMIERTIVAPDGGFRFYGVEAGSYSIRVLAAPGAEPILEAYCQIAPASPPLVLRLPDQPESRPVSGIVSLRELRHKIPKQAFRAAVDAQRYSGANDAARAIGKLEQAVQIDPEFRDAHVNLGAQYARARRYAEAMQEFQRALEIGPPDAILYSNLSWAYSAFHQFPQAEEFARKALALDPENPKARYLLDRALAQQGKTANHSGGPLQLK